MSVTEQREVNQRRFDDSGVQVGCCDKKFRRWNVEVKLHGLCKGSGWSVKWNRGSLGDATPRVHTRKELSTQRWTVCPTFAAVPIEPKFARNFPIQVRARMVECLSRFGATQEDSEQRFLSLIDDYVEKADGRRSAGASVLEIRDPAVNAPAPLGLPHYPENLWADIRLFVDTATTSDESQSAYCF